METSLPLVTVIVVTMNNSALLRSCLKSLSTQDYGAIEIIVVDNGSEEDIKGMVRREFPDVRFIGLDRNWGFAGGNNRGIEKARGKYVALINNDAVASPRWISALVWTAESDRKIGAVASIIRDGNRPGVLDSCGVGIGLDGMSRQAMRGMPVPRMGQPKKVLLFSGCACLLRMEALRDVGLFDEDFFAYCEDTDLGLRMRWAGWEIVVAPGAFVDHYYSMTGGKFSAQKVYWVERNRAWVAIKNFPWCLLAFLPLSTCWRYFVQGYSLSSRGSELNKFAEGHGMSAILQAYLKAYAHMLEKLPSMLLKRHSVFKRRRLEGRAALRLILRFCLPANQVVGTASQRKSIGLDSGFSRPILM